MDRKKGSHQFIFTPGVWIGEGKITFSTSPENIHFYTKWSIDQDASTGGFVGQQQVEMRGVDEKVFNHFIFSQVASTSFTVCLENQLMGKVLGKGVTDQKTIAWEYRQGIDFEGFEVYELQENGDYLLHAEYSSPDQYRTMIEGRLWKKST